VASDIYTLAGKDYLLVVDYFSNYPEVMPLSSKSARSVIDATRSIFSRHGIPVELTSDNIPFTSFEFKQFATHYGFNFNPTSPNHPNSNGKAEKGVQIVKRMLAKCYESKEDPMLALLNYRSTPLSCGKSPAELLMNRQLRNRLPQVFPGSTGVDKGILEKLREGKANQKQYYDRNTRCLVPLLVGQTVRLFDTRTNLFNQKGKVIKKHSHRSYIVETEDGHCLRRNRAHLRVTSEHFNPKFNPDFETAQLISSDNLACSTTYNELIPVGETPVTSGPTAVSMTKSDSNKNTNRSPTALLERPKRNRKPPKRLIEE